MTEERDEPSWARRASLVALVLLAPVLVALHVHDYQRLSPLDELQHLDYLVRIAEEGELVRRGDRFEQESLRTEACQGLDADFPVQPCRRGAYRPEHFQEAGYNTAFVHGPAYYVTSGLLARGASAVVDSDSLFTTGRLTGALWLAGGVAAMWAAMGRLGVGWRSRVPAVLLCVTAPSVLGASSIVNPDATALVFGAATLWAALRWESTGRWMVLALISALAVAFKLTNGVGVVVALGYLVVRWLHDRAASRTDEDDVARAPVRSPLVPVVAGLAAAGIAAGAWIGVTEAIARKPADEIPMVQRQTVDSISTDEVSENLGNGLSPLRGPHIPREVQTAWMRPVNGEVDHLLVAGMVVAALAAVSIRTRVLAGTTLGALLVFGPAFVLATYYSQGTYFPVPDRYALSALPAVAAVSAATLDGRPRIRLGVTAVAVVILLLLVRALVY